MHKKQKKRLASMFFSCSFFAFLAFFGIKTEIIMCNRKYDQNIFFIKARQVFADSAYN